MSDTSGDDSSTTSQSFPPQTKLMALAVVCGFGGCLAVALLRWLVVPSIADAMLITLPGIVGYSVSEFFECDPRHQSASRLKRWSLAIPSYLGIALSAIMLIAALPQTISSFDLHSQDVPHSVLLKYTGPKPLADIDLVISFRLENGERSEIKRFWATWSTGETKIVPLEERATIEKWEFHGQAILEGNRTNLAAAFTK